MNRTFKIIGRCMELDKQPSWARGIPGRQATKRVYTSKEDFDKYSPDTMKRWKEFYYVSAFELINGKWEKIYG